nr:MAG TPA: hypothetical protein [Caudoviricetes sp.]
MLKIFDYHILAYNAPKSFIFALFLTKRFTLHTRLKSSCMGFILRFNGIYFYTGF